MHVVVGQMSTMYYVKYHAKNLVLYEAVSLFNLGSVYTKRDYSSHLNLVFSTLCRSHRWGQNFKVILWVLIFFFILVIEFLFYLFALTDGFF